MTDGLIAFLHARLDADEQAADAVDSIHLDLPEPPAGRPGDQVFLSPEQYVAASGILTGDRIRADVAAKRSVLARYEHHAGRAREEREAGHSSRAIENIREGLYAAVLDLASVYASHPDYLDKWRP